MNAEQRAKLLRERFKARKPSSAILATRTVKGAKWWVCYGSGEIAHGKTAFGPLER